MKQRTDRSAGSDHALGIEREISHRGFITGVAMVAGSFTTVHHLRDIRKADLGDAGHAAETYDLVVAEADVSGLAAASPRSDAMSSRRTRPSSRRWRGSRILSCPTMPKGAEYEANRA